MAACTSATRGALLSRLGGHSASGRGLALSLSGDRVAVGASDGKIRLWKPVLVGCCARWRAMSAR
jgi:hypothetical protein